MSCCGGNCGCASGCNCGSGCGGCKMNADLYGERGTNTAGTIDLGAATQKGRIDGHEVADGSESGGCGCNKCNCGSSCSCACCGCN